MRHKNNLTTLSLPHSFFLFIPLSPRYLIKLLPLAFIPWDKPIPSTKHHKHPNYFTFFLLPTPTFLSSTPVLSYLHLSPQSNASSLSRHSLYPVSTNSSFISRIHPHINRHLLHFVPITPIPGIFPPSLTFIYLAILTLYPIQDDPISTS